MNKTAGCLFYSGICRHPVHLPGFAAISRKGLFKMTRVGLNIRDHKPDENCSAIIGFLIVEFPPSVFELSYCRLAYDAAADPGEIKAPCYIAAGLTLQYVLKDRLHRARQG
jgi:hypothetical protein